jgi:hypothetical protein
LLLLACGSSGKFLVVRQSNSKSRGKRLLRSRGIATDELATSGELGCCVSVALVHQSTCTKMVSRLCGLATYLVSFFLVELLNFQDLSCLFFLILPVNLDNSEKKSTKRRSSRHSTILPERKKQDTSLGKKEAGQVLKRVDNLLMNKNVSLCSVEGMCSW